MDRAEDSGNRDSGEWLLETYRALRRAMTTAGDASEFGESLPDALAEPDGTRLAWIGRERPGEAQIDVRASSSALPSTIDVSTDEQSTTRQATEEGDVQVYEATASPEYRRLRDDHGIAEAGTAASIPLVEAETMGVVHLYLDPGWSGVPDAGTFAELGELIHEGFRSRECRRDLEHERRRLEALRSLVSHDFGSPINLAAGRLDLARTEVESEHLDHVESALEDIDSLTDEGVKFVKAGREVTDRHPVDVEEIARDCWSAAGDGDGTLTVEPVTVYGEPARTRQILTELFENAVVHNDGETEVRVGPLDGPGFYVEDDGEGIPEDEREHVFDRGYTTDSDREGHGLAIAREIADAHGWTVTLDGSDGTRVEVVTGRW